MTIKSVIFNHGKESGPWGRKIQALAEISSQNRLFTHSIDYRNMTRIEDRVARLHSEQASVLPDYALVGSSMGGYVALAAAARLKPEGLFLMAPALDMPGYPTGELEIPDVPVWIVHGWQDDVVPVENSIRFARNHSSTLHILNSEHRLENVIPEICQLFQLFLQELKS